MPKSIWNGTITFGMVNVPVKLYSATESKTVHFHEVHARDGARVEHRRICPKEDKEVPYQEIVRGYEVSEGKYVVLVRARDGALALTTMLFHDEVRPSKAVPTGGKKPSREQLEGAVAIVEELSTEWDPGSYTDCYRERLKRVIDAKRKRKTIEVPKPEKEPDPVPDLMAALEATLERLRQGEDPRGKDGEDGVGAKTESTKPQGRTQKGGGRKGRSRGKAKSAS